MKKTRNRKHCTVHRPKASERQIKALAYWTESDHTVDELIGLLSQEGQTHTHRSTHQISRKTSLTQSSIIRIIHSVRLVWSVFFVYQNACFLLLLVFLTFIFHEPHTR